MTAALASWLATGVSAIGPVGTLTVTNMNVSPDGFNRSIIAVNRQHPSPLITARKGDNFQLTVVNQLTDVTILRQTSVHTDIKKHWHGIFQQTTAWADGPDGVSQCPVAQFDKPFTYKFNAGREAGSFWYHSHFHTQYCDGLRGPLVIYDDKDPHKDRYDIDDETTVITLADWYHLPASTIGKGPAVTNATLINGKGRNPGGPQTELAIVNVRPNKRYRFRLIIKHSGLAYPMYYTINATCIRKHQPFVWKPNKHVGRWRSSSTSFGKTKLVQTMLGYLMGQHGTANRLISLSCDPNYVFSIDGHDLTVIEADGQSTQPLQVQNLTIFAGQRYSFVLKADQPPGNYWIRAVPNTGVSGLLNTSGSEGGGLNSAILRYIHRDVQPVDPTTSPTPNPTILQEENLRSLQNNLPPPVINPGDLDVVTLDPRFNLNPGSDFNFSINGITWESNVENPILLQLLNHVPPDQLVNQGFIRRIKRNDIIEIRLPAVPNSGGPHPFHLHGHAFWVIKSAGTNKTNFVNPVRRDVVNTGIGNDPNDSVILRFRADNPGPWFFHCHIEFHLLAGLAMVFIEDSDNIPKVVKPPGASRASVTLTGTYTAGRSPPECSEGGSADCHQSALPHAWTIQVQKAMET
ncbi:Cu-oxidase-domain-containing protein [Coprinopsis marcescibilis]|uniref:laccase n=1 Tax=Coprinopsis marcescibilis TaxID=230819 RepID=A0A5C3KG72_COPMA|nr:Cu-oxidase-domain-containing protein [Coprinopsis marcescibilis]